MGKFAYRNVKVNKVWSYKGESTLGGGGGPPHFGYFHDMYVMYMLYKFEKI
jgi:hypothetical protein